MEYDAINVYMGTTYTPMNNWKKHADLLPEQRYFAGERIPCEKNGFYYYYIKKGKFKMGVEKADGTTIDYAYCHTGAIIKMNGTILRIEEFDVPFVEAIENSIICAFTLDDIYSLIVQDRGVFDDMMHSSSIFSMVLRQRLMIISGISATNRLLTWLDKLCGCSQADENGIYTIDCNLTQQQIADLLFIHVTTCNKLLSKLKTEEIARHTKKKIYVYRRDKLTSYLNQENLI